MGPFSGCQWQPFVATFMLIDGALLCSYSNPWMKVAGIFSLTFVVPLIHDGVMSQVSRERMTDQETGDDGSC